MPDPDDHIFPEQEQGPSKSELKRRMTALQEMGESLTRLSDRELAQVPLDDERLARAIREARAIRSNSAKRRHLQFIGKLMRDIDPEPIRAALESMHRKHQRQTDAFHEMEQLRDRMLADDRAGVELALDRWPQADRQHLRQLLLQHQREVQRQQPPAASRKLFRYLRELQENYG
jgi:ribosome-associated protein